MYNAGMLKGALIYLGYDEYDLARPCDVVDRKEKDLTPELWEIACKLYEEYGDAELVLEKLNRGDLSDHEKELVALLVYYIDYECDYDHLDILSICDSLYEGGWRKEDRDEIMKEYNISRLNIDRFVEELERLEAKEAE